MEISACRKWYEPRRREEEGEIEIDEEQNGKQVSETMTQTTDKQAGRLRHSQPIDTHWLMHLCIPCIYVFVCMRAFMQI